MRYLALSLVLVCVYLTSDVSGQPCSCDSSKCPEPVCENSEYTFDYCNCCTVCAKQFGETCGGFLNFEGTCDKNLTCGVISSNSSGEVCLDVGCKAIVDFVFALEGTDEWATLDAFNDSKTWSRDMIRKIYEMYGACAHVEVMQFAGIGDERDSVYPMELDLCTNNNDCVERKMDSMPLLGHIGRMTFTTLLEIFNERFPMSYRYERSQKVIIVQTFGGTTDTEMADEWLTFSQHNNILTYATRVGAPEEELLNITGDMTRIRVQSDVNGFMDLIWRDTVDTTNQCPPGEVYFECLQDCEPTCEDQTPGCNGICIGSGCACGKLHVRHNGVCIPEKQCNATVCPHGEIYKPCASECEPTCDNPTPFCIESCATPGKCQCMDDYVRENGNCIPNTECSKPNNCSYGEEYRNCSSCTPTCDNPDPICATVCGPPRCQCKTNYVRLNGACVPKAMCPKGNCSYGEEFRNCSSYCTPTCDDLHPTCIQICGPPKCQCMKGYVRHNGMCMPEDMCPRENCTYGEEFVHCSSVCTPTCDDPDPVCIEICGPPKCQCMSGYVRHNGTCIPYGYCPSNNCTYGEEFAHCSSMCTPTCDDPYPNCIQACGPPKCQCMSGYVRHNGTCMPYGYCPIHAACEYPKVAYSCPSKCQPTCDNPNPWYCESGCAHDPCVCPVDHVLLSEYDRRCVHQFECPTKACSRECPSIDQGMNAREVSKAWICHFQKWRCTSYEWKLSVEEWWYSSGCYAVGGDIEYRWRRLFECPHHVNISCTYPDQYEYDMDAFGCEMGRCRDGYYRDNTQFMKLWMAHQMKYQEKMQLYNEATAMCGRNLDVGPGCHGGIASHAKPQSSSLQQMISAIVIGLLFTAASM